MFQVVAKAKAIAAVAAISAVAPAVASADQWTVAGSPHAGTAHMSGRVTLTIPSISWQVSCDATASLDLSNPSGNASGQASSIVFGAPAGGNCVTNLPNCLVAASAAGGSLPWAISTSGTSVTISGVAIEWVYTGTGCGFAGLTLAAYGSITGTASGGVIGFMNAGPLTTAFGAGLLHGSVALRTTTGDPIALS